ncbi:hypothetical protein COCCU_06425 [Corynebacterium occultum]|uniref:Uncharacterized protein n=1 Tax=Corynebacterium occultum TaxID=2675219 RepID=A0A6B8W123_9CORY|nr:hypothetical protein [Corynebacterium occultum]QGU07224.1 hypothetical protein COCCU_06425 [Corynebacterium occultum]
MRRSLIALATAATLTLGTLPVAHAQSSEEVQGSLETLPAEFKIGSSAVDDLQEGAGTEAELQQGSSDLGKDWLIGAVVTTLLGIIITTITGALR